MNNNDNISQGYAAVAIPTLNRYEHFVKCVESLANNSYAKYTDLYIGVDFPPADKYVEGNKKIIEYLQDGIKGFANVYVYTHESNLGVKGNADFVIEKATEHHKTFIFSEDDNVFSNNYLEYVNRSLEMFETDDTVVAVSGYNYPMDRLGKAGEIYRNNSYFAAFGFASWKVKYYNMLNSMTVDWLHDTYSNLKFMREFGKKSPNQFCNFVKAMLEYTTPIEGEDGVWKMDMTYGVHMASNGNSMIFPVISKVKNMGYDGTGVNCDIIKFDSDKKVTHRNFSAESQVVDGNDRCEKIILVSESEESSLIDKVNDFFEIPGKEYCRTWLAYIVSRIIGINSIRKIMRKLR